jgi:hypothetical protein
LAWAEACADEGLRLVVEIDEPNLACRHRVALAEVMGLRGRVDDGRRMAEAALAEAMGRGLRGTAAIAHRVLGELALMRGDGGEAARYLDAIWGLGTGVRRIAVSALPDLIEAERMIGRPGAGQDRLPALLEWARAGSHRAGVSPRPRRDRARGPLLPARPHQGATTGTSLSCSSGTSTTGVP